MAFRYYGAALYAVRRHASGCCVAWPVHAPKTQARRPRSSNPRQRRRPVKRPRAQKGGGRRPAEAMAPMRRPRRHRLRGSTACRRIPPPNRRWRCPGARSTSPRPPARSGCSTTRASRRPTSPTPPTSSTAPIARTRPVTFLFNGGPGASSAWLQFGDAGPWRLSISGDGAVSSASPDLVPNAETWLDFTDLVFIDPVGTGYSRFVASGEDVRKRFFSVDGDVSSIALVIRRWLEKYDRLLSPKFVAGESYGGIRGPKIVRNLQTQQGVGVSGLILVSPVLDFREYSGSSLLQYVNSLPTMAAVAREAKGPVTCGRPRRRRTLCARRLSARSDQGTGRHRGHQPARRQGGGIDRHRSGGEPQARRAFRRRRIPPRVRPQQRPGDRTL